MSSILCDLVTCKRIFSPFELSQILCPSFHSHLPVKIFTWTWLLNLPQQGQFYTLMTHTYTTSVPMGTDSSLQPNPDPEKPASLFAILTEGCIHSQSTTLSHFLLLRNIWKHLVSHQQKHRPPPFSARFLTNPLTNPKRFPTKTQSLSMLQTSHLPVTAQGPPWLPTAKSPFIQSSLP